MDQSAQERKGHRGTRQFYRVGQAILFALAASGLSLFLYYLHPAILDDFDKRGRDIVFRLRDAPDPPPEIVIVAVDEKSVRQFGRWPWPRAIQAVLIGSLKDMGAGTIALDIIYAHPTHEACRCPEQDEDLIAALQWEGAPVIGGYFFREEKTFETDPAFYDILRENRIRQKLLQPGADLSAIPERSFVESSQPEIAVHFSGMGSFTSFPDADGLVRSAPLLVTYKGEQYPSLSIKALSAYVGMEIGIVADAAGVTSLRLGPITIPTDEKGRLASNFYFRSSAGTVGRDLIPIYSASDVITGELDPELIAGRLVFVGVTEIGIADLVATPVSSAYPGIGIHATAAANILQEYYLYHGLDTVLIDVAAMALVPMLLVIIMSFVHRMGTMTLVFLTLLAALAAFFYWMVTDKGLLVSFVYPLAAVATAYVTFQLYFLLGEQRKSRFLTDAFGSYVAPALVERLLKDPDSLGLAGEKREITVLFSDIRGFTNISETMPPERLVQMLNHYLGEMSQIVLDQHGTLDKYIGDAIMALFNAPLDIPEHPRRAADAALEMMHQLHRTQGEYKKEYGVDLNIGVGLHAGDAIVGNLGSAQRFDYTAIGDTVNLASRLEGATKTYRVDIIVSETVHAELGDAYPCRRLDNIQVKGKQIPIVVFELMTEPDQALAERFETALSLYLGRQFADALSTFNGILADGPDGPSGLYVARCQEFMKHPPGPDWDGVYVATGK